MGTEVITRTHCDRCGAENERQSAEYEPPVGWAECTLSYWGSGSGWSGGGQRIRKELCPDCARIVEAALAKENHA